jgi:hypothetical protein
MEDLFHELARRQMQRRGMQKGSQGSPAPPFYPGPTMSPNPIPAAPTLAAPSRIPPVLPPPTFSAPNQPSPYLLRRQQGSIGTSFPGMTPVLH